MANLNLDHMINTSGATGITTTYSTAKAIALNYTKFGTSQINVLASMLEVQLSNISGANKVYASLSRDPAGDVLVMTETRSDVQTGITTATKGAVLYRLDVIIRDLQDKVLYLHVRTNTGTCDVDEASLTYQY
jgi:hypothetical protein